MGLSLVSAGGAAISYVALPQTVIYQVTLTANYSTHLEISDGRNSTSVKDDELYRGREHRVGKI
jgi:hypothetical protein